MNNSKTNLATPTPQIKLELLALALDGCTRCVGTLDNIETAIKKVESVLKLTGTEIELNKILIESEEEAKKHRLAISPTVRINDHDIILETLESECDSCNDLCGCEEGTSCRVWKYQGEEYMEAPVGLIVESLIAEIYGGNQETIRETEPYQEVPLNLKRFFASKAEKEASEVSDCCSAEKQETCCESSEKQTCCQTEEAGTCGCQ